MRDPWEKTIPGQLLGKEEKMATDLADEIFGKKAGRIISEWLRMSVAGQWPLAGSPYFETELAADQKPNL